MKRHQRIASSTGSLPTALHTPHDRGKASPVHKDQRLLTFCEAGLDGENNRRRKTVTGSLMIHIHQGDLRQIRTSRPLREPQVNISAAQRVCQTLERRSGRPQNHRNGGQLRSFDGHIAGAVAKSVLLLVREVVLFVHNNETGSTKRSEYCRPGAQDHEGFARSALPPGEVALLIGQTGVQHRDPTLNSFTKTRNQLRRQRDFRHQYQSLLSALHHRLRALKINLCLSATGHPIQKIRRIGSKALLYGLARFLLSRVQLRFFAY